jgi:HEPN domain-containing protein
MTVEDRIQYWVHVADDDLKIGFTMFRGEHFHYVGFMCHQVIEKLLKACYVKVNEKPAPFTHDSEVLARKSGIWDLLTTEQRTFINSVTLYNIEARYPGEEEDLGGQQPEKLTPETACEILGQTELLQQWIREKILST